MVFSLAMPVIWALTLSLPSWLGLSSLWSPWTCLVFTGPDSTPDLWGDFPAWPWTHLNTVVPPCDPDSWLDCLSSVLVRPEAPKPGSDSFYLLSLGFCRQPGFTQVVLAGTEQFNSGIQLGCGTNISKQVRFKAFPFERGSLVSLLSLFLSVLLFLNAWN